MEPLSIATGVISLCGACLVTVKRLGDIASKFKDASRILLDVSSKAKIIELSLSQLHNTFVSDESSILDQALLTPDIRGALDICLTGCTVTLQCIEDELNSLDAKIHSNQNLNFADRLKVIWKDGKFKELLERLHGQHEAIVILQQGFQMKALADILSLLRSKNATMQEVADGTQSLRGLYPHVNAAKSFLESSESQSGSGDERTYSMVSVVSEKDFVFDDCLTSSQVYRRVLIAATHISRNTKSENIIPNRDSSQYPLNRTNSNEVNPTGINTANQGRKISPSVPPRNSRPPITATEIHIDPALRMNTTHSDAFLQQSRECNDPLEGDLAEAMDMTMKLREAVQQRDTEINRLESDFQSSVAKVPEAELQPEQALAREKQHSAECQTVSERLQAELDKYRKLYNDAAADIHSVREILQAQEVKSKTLELNLTTSQSETKVASEEMQRHKEEAQLHKDNSQKLKKDAQRNEGERVEMIRRIESELRISFDLRTWNSQQLLEESRDELRCSERDLVTTRQQRDAFQKRFNFLRCQSQQLLKGSKDDLLSIEEKLVAIQQERDSLQKKWDLTRIQSRRLLRESRDDLHEANNKLILARQERDSVQESLTTTTHQFRNTLQKKEKDHDIVCSRLAARLTTTTHRFRHRLRKKEVDHNIVCSRLAVRLNATTHRFRNRLKKKKREYDIVCAQLAVLEQHAQGYEALKRAHLQERQDREAERTRLRQQIKDVKVLSWAACFIILLFSPALCSVLVQSFSPLLGKLYTTVNFRRDVDLTQASGALSIGFDLSSCPNDVEIEFSPKVTCAVA